MMKKIFIFNSFDHGSTGTICDAVIDRFKMSGIETQYIVSNKPKNNNGNYYLYDHTTLLNRFFSCKNYLILRPISFLVKIINSHKVLRYIKKHLDVKNECALFNFHNMQFMFLDVFSIMKFAKRHNIKIVWSLHDCWPITGGCWHFGIPPCNKWMINNKCTSCPKRIHFSTIEKNKKIKIYNDMIDNILLISPSEWLNNIVADSILHNAQHTCIHNGIDIGFWSDNNSRKYNSEMIVLLSVASAWSTSKGLQILNRLAELLPKNYLMIVAGLKDEVKTNKKIKRIGVVNSIELLSLYQSSHIFVNPTLEDNFPTVNIEALLCGLPIVSFDIGGVSETYNEHTGRFATQHTAEALLKEIVMIKPNKALSIECRKRGELFSKESFVETYFNKVCNFWLE